MNWKFIIIIVTIGLVFGLIIWLILHFADPSNKIKKPKTAKEDASDPLNTQTDDAVKSIFNDEFREELRNRGRIHFEKIIGENAMFLQQDLQLTTSQLNSYMKQEITKKLQEEFHKYEQSIVDAKQLALQSIRKTQDVIEQQRQSLSQQVKKELAEDKTMLLSHFEDNMAAIVNHYILAAIGNQIDLTDQLDFIIGELERNKKAIIQDINDGAS